MWWQQDGCPAHFDRIFRDHLNEVFPNRWIGRGGPIPWSPRSADITPPDFFVGCDVQANLRNTDPLWRGFNSEKCDGRQSHTANWRYLCKHASGLGGTHYQVYWSQREPNWALVVRPESILWEVITCFVFILFLLLMKEKQKLNVYFLYVN